MRTEQYSNLFLFLFISLSFPTITNQNEDVYRWTWKCVKAMSTCVPFKSDGNLQSLATCNMICSETQIWPHPTGPVSLSNVPLAVRADHIKLRSVMTPSHVLQAFVNVSFSLMIRDLNIQGPLPNKHVEWQEVLVDVEIKGSADPRMLVDTDESYQLTVNPTSEKYLLVEINARSFCGARHALETLSQLVWWDPYVGSLMILNEARVVDAPRFAYRGLMLDTSRNFFPVLKLLHIVDAMGANKLNTFHWHLSDAHAFSIKLNTVSQLAENGALGAYAMYSTHDVRRVVRRARLRGVRVLLELDLPRAGRAWDWSLGAGYGLLTLCTTEKFNEYCDDPPCGHLNPHNTLLYNILQQIYAEIIKLTGVDDVFHLGGDDVSEDCWREYYNVTNILDIWMDFTKRALQRLTTANGNRTPNLTLMWKSPLSEYLKSNLEMYVPYLGLQIRRVNRKLAKEMKDVKRNKLQGMRTVFSEENAWDFNSVTGPWYEGCRSGQNNNWQRVYEHRPWALDDEGVVGGEGLVWSGEAGPELQARLWPRAAALAERLWTDGPAHASRLVWARLSVHRDRLVARGVHATPIHPTWCKQDFASCWGDIEEWDDNITHGITTTTVRLERQQDTAVSKVAAGT